MKNNYIFQSKNEMRKVTFLIVWLNRRDTGWILASAVEFNLLPYDLLVKVYKQNLASQKYAFGKERSILIFLDNYRYFSPVLFQNSTSGSFLNVSCSQ